MPRLFVLSIFLAPLLALAEPATVKRFEAPAHERPDAASPTVHTFIEKASLSVSEEAENGFRKVRLPNGNVGWIEEAALAFEASTAEPPAATVAVEGTAEQPVGADGKAYPDHAPLRSKEEVLDASAKQATIYIKSLNHLAELVKDDDLVAPMASSLATRQTAGMATMWGSIGVGLAASVIGMFVVPQTDCRAFGTSQMCLPGTANYAVFGAGLGLAVVGSVVGFLIIPKGDEFLDMINTWNVRHPDEQFSLTPMDSGYNRQRRRHLQAAPTPPAHKRRGIKTAGPAAGQVDQASVP